jgi:hypothetical protein
MRRARVVNQEDVITVQEVADKSAKPPIFSFEQLKTFKQQSCEVLDILEKNGINIYDEDRYGGMYLTHNKNKISNNIKKYFHTKNEDNQQEDNSNLFATMATKYKI